MADADKHISNKIITRDKTWCFACDPERKQQSSEWGGETSPLPKKLKFHRSHIKITLIDFRLSRPSAQNIRTSGENSKCRILLRSKNSPPENHSTGSSSCVLLSRDFLVAR